MSNACRLKATRNTKIGILKQIKANSPFVGDMLPNGASFKVSNAILQSIVDNINDVDGIIEATQLRSSALGKSYHQALRTEMGEELQITRDGKNEAYYLLDSDFISERDDTDLQKIRIKIAPANNVAAVESVEFYVGRSTSIDTKTTINGFAELAGRAAIRNAAKQIQNHKVFFEETGFSEVDSTLQRMGEANKIFGSTGRVKAENLMGYEVVQNYKHGDPKAMKEMLAKLHTLGGGRASESTLKYYNNLLDRMHPRFFNELELFIKKNTNDSKGWVIPTEGKMAIQVARKDKTTYMSDAEVYMHEVILTMVTWALEQVYIDTTKIKRDIETLMRVAQENLTWKDFLLVPEDIATKHDKDMAKAFEKNVFSSIHHVEKFIAYGMTNLLLMTALGRLKVHEEKKAVTGFEKLTSLISRLYNFVLGRAPFRTSNENVSDALHKLAFQLAEINTAQAAKLEQLNPVGRMMTAITNADAWLGKKLEEFRDKSIAKSYKIDRVDRNAPLIKQAMYLLKVGTLALINPTYRSVFGAFATAVGIKPDSTMREIVRSFFEKTEDFRAAEKLLLLSNHNDAIRNSTITAASRELMESFTRPLSIQEDEAITEVLLETNLSGLLFSQKGAKKYSKAELARLLADPEYATERYEIASSKLRKLLKNDKERSDWTINQAKGLGFFMVTGRPSVAQNLNARNITVGLGNNTMYKFDAEVLGVVRELASIYSLQYLNKKDRELVSELIKEQGKGVQTIASAYEAYKINSETQLFSKNKVHMLDGHLYEQFDQTIDVRIAPISSRSELEASGFVYRHALTPLHNDAHAEPMGFFVTNSWGRAERQRGAMSLGNYHTRGTTLTEMKFTDGGIAPELRAGRDLARVHLEAVKVHEQMRKGTYDINNAVLGMAPVYNSFGKVVDYRYMMSKEHKKELLGQDKRATQVVPRSTASIIGQLNSEKTNKAVWDMLYSDAKENWVSGELGEDGVTHFTTIGPKATNEKGRQIYNMLPEEFRDKIKHMPNQEIGVRTHLLPIVFGYKHLQLTDMVGIRSLPNVMKHMINVTEGYWNELVKVSKGNILIKMPVVVYANLKSNLMYLLVTGSWDDTKRLWSDHKNAATRLDDYIRLDRERNRLLQQINIAKADLGRVRNKKALVEKIDKMNARVDLLSASIRKNPAHSLMEAGMYQSYVVDVSNSTLEETNRITKGINKALGKAPKHLRMAAEWSYLSQNTSWYTKVQELLQRSDMIARLVDQSRQQRAEQRVLDGVEAVPEWFRKHKEWNKERGKVGLTKEDKAEFKKLNKVRVEENLLDAYVNYTLPNGRLEEYLNRIGVLMFTKYLKRIQNIIFKSALSNPIKTSLLMLASSQVTNLENIQDSSFLLRATSGSEFIDFTRLTGTYSPFYHIENVLTPSLFKESLLGGVL